MLITVGFYYQTGRMWVDYVRNCWLNIYNMGMTVSKYTTPVKNYVTGKKRKYDLDESDEAMNRIIDETMHTPKR